MAARFDAVIVPFGAVGAADTAAIALDSDQLAKVPGLGSRVADGAAAVPAARRGMWARGADDYAAENFAFPLVVPSPTGPDRFYFKFGSPVDTAGIDHKDAEALDQVGGWGGGWMGDSFFSIFHSSVPPFLRSSLHSFIHPFKLFFFLFFAFSDLRGREGGSSEVHRLPPRGPRARPVPGAPAAAALRSRQRRKAGADLHAQRTRIILDLDIVQFLLFVDGGR